ncbi:MAG TPA: SDR family oxidoreductase [Candidatus Dormibacteraeota bacterium]|nr:SDR family oxidoreductase [Candidatus Dormibacteraeota bacterium]
MADAYQRAAFVTGAGSGIGRATSRRLARDGYAVGVFDLDPNGVEGTVDGIVSTGGQAVGFVGDVRDEAAVTSALEALAREASLWLVANVAGVGVAATVVETTNEEWQRVISVNLTGTFIVCRAAVPIMLRSGGGVIVNVASAGGLVGIAERAAYCASKAGVIGLTRAIAVDHAAAGLRAVAICPGTVESEWITKILANHADPSGARRAMSDRQLDGRMGTPDEVAAGIAFVASPDGRFINGSELVMDGGMTAR